MEHSKGKHRMYFCMACLIGECGWLGASHCQNGEKITACDDKQLFLLPILKEISHMNLRLQDTK